MTTLYSQEIVVCPSKRDCCLSPQKGLLFVPQKGILVCPSKGVVVCPPKRDCCLYTKKGIVVCPSKRDCCLSIIKELLFVPQKGIFVCPSKMESVFLHKGVVGNHLLPHTLGLRIQGIYMCYESYRSVVHVSVSVSSLEF